MYTHMCVYIYIYTYMYIYIYIYIDPTTRPADVKHSASGKVCEALRVRQT